MSESTYKNYFLGSLAAELTAELELRVLEDPEFAAELESVEERLIEDYLEGQLSPEDSALFQTNYLNTEERRKNVDITKLMIRYARENEGNENQIMAWPADNSPSFLGWFSNIGWGIRLAAASVVLAGVIVTVWFVSRPQRNDELIALQDRYEKLSRDVNFAPTDRRVSEIALVSAASRGSDSGPALAFADLTEDVRLRVALQPSKSAPVAYNVAIFRDGTEVFRLRNIHPIVGTNSSELRLLVPRGILTSGNYRIGLQTDNTSDLNYYFVVK